MDSCPSLSTSTLFGPEAGLDFKVKRVKSVGILGAGRIAQGFDKPGDSRILTLAHAVTRCPRLCLGGFYDCCLTATRKAERKWKTPPSPRNREEWLGAGWDIVCIATSDDSHAKDLSDVLNHSPKAILVEKPLTQEDRIGQQLLRKARKLI
jgi:predicted dehydrogenase